MTHSHTLEGSVFLIEEAEFGTTVLTDMLLSSTSVDGWAEQLLKLGYEKEKHFKKESVIIVDSLQNTASGQTNMVGSADRVSYSK